jgi:hypothetical protein
MDIASLLTSVVWVDFLVICASHIFNLGKTIHTWYRIFGIVAVFSDCLIIILGIMLANLFFPTASTFTLILIACTIQIIHDFLFYYFIILPIPRGTNAMIDTFKDYAHENSYQPIIADTIMVASSILLYSVLKKQPKNIVSFAGFLGLYAITYIIYTK